MGYGRGRGGVKSGSWKVEAHKGQVGEAMDSGTTCSLDRKTGRAEGPGRGVEEGGRGGGGGMEERRGHTGTQAESH